MTQVGLTESVSISSSGTSARPSVALVTGAAGGIGHAIARAIAERGGTVAAVDHDATRLREAVDKLVADGLDVRAFPADLRDHETVAALVAAVEREVGPIDQLVNCAGVLRLGAITALSHVDARETLAVNTEGVLYVSQLVADHMVRRRRGAIVTVASNAAHTPRAGMGIYGASKAAAAMITTSLGLEVARHGVRCNVVAPGSTDTPMLRGMWHDDADRARTIAGDLEHHRLGIPVGRVARPENVADAVLFLLSDQAAHITLETLTVDGGATLGR